ncbi:hypothetical protein LN047_20955 [Achromobacter sp. JD417]|uniref:hypothetical protein n=1 Tax=unclassified Achromobacter TaxID=2626865 RepID=UPI0009536EF5|nr:hypothetical protein [Achromobacter sp. MFA1 R4]SIT04536.1 hypothetical protein SAMN05428937_0387 [Achromobacter sp. MFA1 R4]
MLSAEAAVSPRSFAYTNGMMNAVWLVGELFSVDREAGRCEILISNKSPHYRVSFEFDVTKGVGLPKYFKPGDVIAVTALVRSDLIDGEYSLTLKALHFQAPSVRDLRGDDLRDYAKRMNGAILNAAGAEPGRQDAFTYKIDRAQRKRSNVIRLAGFVHAMEFERGEPHPETQEPTGDKLVLLLRQFENADKCIPIRIYGRQAGPFYTAIRKAKRNGPLAIHAMGELYVKVKTTPSPDADAEPDVRRVPIIKAIGDIERLDFDSGLIGEPGLYPWLTEYLPRELVSTMPEATEQRA